MLYNYFVLAERRRMKYSEFKKWLKKQGAVFTAHRSGSSHYRVTLNGKSTIFPDHGNKEIGRSEEHTSELQSLMRNSYAVFCLKQTNTDTTQPRAPYSTNT